MLVSYHDDSPAKLLKTVFPEYKWLPWRFSKVSKGFWDKIENRKSFVEWVEKELNIKKQEDWYNVDIKVGW